MSLALAVILIVAVFILALAIATTKTVGIIPDTEFIIDGQYAILDNIPLLPEGKE